jgi:S1-C subfamily serine protease
VQLLDIVQDCKSELLKKKNVIGIGIGHKNDTERGCITVTVSEKVPLEELETKDWIPEEIHCWVTDVFEVPGGFRLLQRTDKVRPAMPGISIGHIDVTAGTFGCVVEKVDAPEDKYILSNNHVLANINQGQIGDPILQPGAADGGKNPDDVIAYLAEFVPLQLEDSIPTDCAVAGAAASVLNALAWLVRSKQRVRAYTMAEANLFDAALAAPLRQGDIVREILEIGKPIGTKQASLGDWVQKSGRTTGVTTGVVTQVAATVQVQMGAGVLAIFDDQIISDIGSAGGDSGSAILNDSKQVMGLLFAGGSGVTVFNNIGHILDAYGVRIAT